MEEMMMMKKNERYTHRTNHDKSLTIPTVTSPPTCPTWKLYENPFFSPLQKPQRINRRNRDRKLLASPENQDQESAGRHQNLQVHRLHLPVPTRKFAASFWDLTFIKPPPPMGSDLEEARAQLEQERRSRKKTEANNKKLSTELSEERHRREALERVCEDLAGKISREKTEGDRLRKEIGEERRMLRAAEVIREERVQMKLAEAKMLMEEKLSEIESAKAVSSPSPPSSFSRKEETKNGAGNDQEQQHSNGNLRRASPESENHHIRRGIKGFVEFPRVVRTIACRSSGKNVGGSKLECQRAQLKILLKQKSAIRFNNGLITS